MRSFKNKKKFHSQANIINKFQSNFDGMDSKLSKLKGEISRVSHRASYWKSKAPGLREGNATKTRELHQEIEALKEKIPLLTCTMLNE